MVLDMVLHTTPKFFDTVKCHDRYLLEYGGAGSGKSYRIAQKILLRILKAEKEGYQEGFLCLRKTSVSVKHSVFALFREYIHLWELPDVVTNKAEMSFTFPGGSFIICSGLDDPEKIKSIQGITSIWMEEATEFTLADFRQLDLRLRGDTPSYKQIIMSFNPMDDLSWVRDEFFDSEKYPKLETWDDGKSFRIHNATIIHSTWRDNKFIDDQYSDMLAKLKEKDPVRWSIYDQGLWTALAQRIYVNYEEIPDSDWPNHFDDEIYGLDFGYANETALIHVRIVDDQVYERELIYEKEMKNSERIARLRELGVPPRAEIHADPSEPEFIDEIYDAGFNIAPALNAVIPGIDLVNTKRPKILTSSANHLKEKRGYQRKQDRNGNILEEPIKKNDHLQDAERYALYSYYKNLGLIPKVLGHL